MAKLARGRPGVDRVQDPVLRRALESNNQNIEYLLRKVMTIRDRPEEGDDSSAFRIPKKKEKWPKCVYVSGVWVEPSSGVITGKVNPMGAATSYYFQYMHVHYNAVTGKYPDPDFSSATKTSTKSAGSGVLNVDVSETITGLDVPARYYVQVIAWNANGSAASNIGYFDTGKLPEVVVTDATDVRVVRADLNGTVDPNSLSTLAHFEWGSTIALGNVTGNQSMGSGTTPVAITATLTGLSANTKYYFRLSATNAVGTATSEILNFTTMAKQAPQVSLGIVTNKTDRSAMLNGQVNPMGLSTTYYFEWDTGEPFHNTTPVTDAGEGISGVAVSETILGLLPSTLYEYRLVATNSEGTSVTTIDSFVTYIAVMKLTGTLDFGRIFTDATGTADLVINIKNDSGVLTPTTLDWTQAITLDAGISGKISGLPDHGHLANEDDEDITVTLTKSGIAAGTYAGNMAVSAPYIVTQNKAISLVVVPVYTGHLYATVRQTDVMIQVTGTEKPADHDWGYDPATPGYTDTTWFNYGSYTGWLTALMWSAQLQVIRDATTLLYSASWHRDPADWTPGTFYFDWTESELSFASNGCPLGDKTITGDSNVLTYSPGNTYKIRRTYHVKFADTAGGAF